MKGLIGPSHHEIYKACTLKGGRVGGGGYLFEFILCVLRQIVSRMFIVVYTPPDLAGTSVCVQWVVARANREECSAAVQGIVARANRVAGSAAVHCAESPSLG